MAGSLGRAFVEVFADLKNFTPGLRQKIKAALDEQTKGLKFDELDKSAEKAGEHAADELGRGVDRKIENNMEKSGRKGGISLGKGIGAGFSFAAAAFMPVLIGLAVELVAALAPAATALAATIPAAITVMVGSLAALKLATKGVGDALKFAFDPANAKQFDAAMKKLSPSAREFVRDMQKLHPVFHQLQQDVQNAFFNQLEGDITYTARSLLPVLHSGLLGLSVDIGKIGSNLITAFGSARSRNEIAAIFTNAHNAITPFIPALGRLAGAFLSISAAAGPLVTTLSTGFASLLSRFSAFINEAADSGALSKFFADALIVLQQLGGLLGNVFDLVTSILTALQAQGGQALGFLSTLIGQLAAFFATAQGKQALANIFLLLNTALESLTTILTPLLPIIAQFAGELAGELAGALKTITPYLEKVSGWLAQHPDLLKAAAAAWLVYRAALVAVAVYEAIVDALNPVGWIILAVAAIAAGAYLIYKNWGAVTRALSSAWEAIKGFFTGIWHWIQDVGASIGNWFTVTLPNFFASIPGKIWAALQALPGLLGQLFLNALHAAGEAIGIGIGLILALWIKVPQLIWEALQKIPGIVANLWHQAIDWGTNIVRQGIAAIVYIFTVLPGKIGSFMTRLPGIIGGAFRDAWNWAKREVSEGANAIVAFVQRLPGRISGFMRNVGHDILGGLRSGINSVISGFNSGIDKVAGLVHIGLPHIPLLASGGLVNAPTLAVVGEAGPEAIIPMSDPARAAAVAKQTGLLDILGSKMSNAGTTLVRVYLGTREITDILNVQIDKKLDAQANELSYGTR
ncbi:MAG TPA: hypothetical protein VFW27_05255 [Actinoplanes sp.]|nr:hypothetical protein [Actinoplanes sp.]